MNEAKNELVTVNEQLGVRYQPAHIEFNNYEDIKQELEDVAKKYDGLVFDVSDKGSAIKTRSELIEREKALKEATRAIKDKYNQPLNEIMDKFNELEKIIDKPLQDVRDAIREIEQLERDERKEKIDKFINEKLGESEFEISLEELEFNKSWTNKGSFTKSGEVTKKIKDEIIDEITSIEKEIAELESQKEILEKFCADKDIDPAGWVQQLEFRSVTEIMDEINQEETARKEQERIEKEAAEQAEKEEQEEQTKTSPVEPETKMESVEYNQPEQETQAEKQAPEQEKEQVITNVIRVTGSFENLLKLNEFAQKNNIKIEGVE